MLSMDLKTNTPVINNIISGSYISSISFNMDPVWSQVLVSEVANYSLLCSLKGFQTCFVCSTPDYRTIYFVGINW